MHAIGHFWKAVRLAPHHHCSARRPAFPKVSFQKWPIGKILPIFLAWPIPSTFRPLQVTKLKKPAAKATPVTRRVEARQMREFALAALTQAEATFRYLIERLLPFVLVRFK
jgi:hypothetical protein